jgi:hypothetical protein
MREQGRKKCIREKWGSMRRRILLQRSEGEVAYGNDWADEEIYDKGMMQR